MGRLILAFVLVLVPAMAEASAPKWRVELGGGGQWVTDSSYQAVSSSTPTTRFVLAAGWTPGWLEERLSLRASYGAGGSGTRLFSSWLAEFSLTSLEVGARYDFLTSGRTKAFARGGALFDVALLDISAGESTIAASSFGAGVTGAVGAELSFNSPASEARVRFSALVEGGWSQRFPKARFNGRNAARHDAEGPAPIGSVPVNVGDIDLSGPFVHAAAVIRF